MSSCINSNSFSRNEIIGLISVAVLGATCLGLAPLLSHLKIINNTTYLAGLISGSAVLGIDAIVFMVLLCKRSQKQKEEREHDNTPPGVIHVSRQSQTFDLVAVNLDGIKDNGTSYNVSEEF